LASTTASATAAISPAVPAVTVTEQTPAADSPATTVTVTPPAGNAAFVTALYQDLLHRPGQLLDPGDAGHWVAGLDGGALTRQAVADAIAHSPEASGVTVDGLYHALLGRAADPTGLADHVAALQHGGTVEQVAVALLVSPEYASLYPSDGDYVRSLYQKL